MNPGINIDIHRYNYINKMHANRRMHADMNMQTHMRAHIRTYINA